VSNGQVVFVNVTSDWCLTCKANKALVLERDPMRAALSADGITLMQADWTCPHDATSCYLESFDRYGIPFNAVYGPDAPEGIVLSEILTEQSLLKALDQFSTTLHLSPARQTDWPYRPTSQQKTIAVLAQSVACTASVDARNCQSTSPGKAGSTSWNEGSTIAAPVMTPA